MLMSYEDDKNRLFPRIISKREQEKEKKEHFAEVGYQNGNSMRFNHFI